MTHPAEPEPVDEPTPAPTGAPAEPVALSTITALIVSALVSAGWFSFDSLPAQIATTVVGAVLAVGMLLYARARATGWPLRPELLAELREQLRRQIGGA